MRMTLDFLVKVLPILWLLPLGACSLEQGRATLKDDGEVSIVHYRFVFDSCAGCGNFGSSITGRVVELQLRVNGEYVTNPSDQIASYYGAGTDIDGGDRVFDGQSNQTGPSTYIYAVSAPKPSIDIDLITLAQESIDGYRIFLPSCDEQVEVCGSSFNRFHIEKHAGFGSNGEIWNAVPGSSRQLYLEDMAEVTW